MPDENIGSMEHQVNKSLQEKLQGDAVSSNEIYKFLTSHWQHHNQLCWSKLYVILALETGVLTGGGKLSEKSPNMACAMLLIGTLVGVIIYALMRRDWEVRDECAKALDNAHSHLGIRMIPGAKWLTLSGQFLLMLLLLILLFVNIAAAFYWTGIL